MNFIQLLKEAKENRKITFDELADLVEVSHGFPAMISSGSPARKTAPHIPDGRAKIWADALHLEGVKREEFLYANAWHYASEDQREEYKKLLDEVRSLNAIIAKVAGLIDLKTIEASRDSERQAPSP